MKTLLFTGSQGFLGKNIYELLSNNYDISTLGRSEANDINLDISNQEPVLNKRYDIVFHAAGHAHILRKKKDDDEIFFRVNLEGTKNICKGLEKIGFPKVFIFISTVAVYGEEQGKFIDEDCALRGNSSYAKSKIAAEEFLREWSDKNKVNLIILRLPLIVGYNPKGNLKSIIDAIKNGTYFNIGKGNARRSMVLASDIAKIVPLVENKSGTYNLSDDTHPSFYELSNAISSVLKKGKVHSIPYWLARVLSKIGDFMPHRFGFDSKKLNKMINTLTFSNKKIKEEINYIPSDVLSQIKNFL